MLLAPLVWAITVATAYFFVAKTWWFPPPISQHGIAYDAQFNRTLVIVGIIFVVAQFALGYAIMLADLVLAPFTPSNTARSGGTIYPVIRNLPGLYNSLPNDPSSRRIGSYLMWVAIASVSVSSSLFLTGMAPNLATAPAVAKNVYGVVITSSPGAMSSAIKHARSASLPEETPIACEQFEYVAMAISHCSTFGPSMKCWD